MPAAAVSSGVVREAVAVVNWLGSLLASLVLGVVVHWWWDRRARGRRVAAASGETVVVRCRLRFAGQRRFRGGRLLIGGGRVLCRARRDSRDLGGARVLRTRRVVTGDRSDNQDFVLMFDLGDTLLEVALAERDMDTVADAVADSRCDGPTRYDGQPARRMPLWSAGMLVLAASVAAAYLYLYLAGAQVDARVLTGSNGAACQVTWPDPGTAARRHASLDCADGTRPGDRLPVLALPWPFRGNAFDLYDTQYGFIVAFGVLLLPAVAGIGWRTFWSPWARRRTERILRVNPARPGAAARIAAAPSTPPERPGRIGMDELGYRRIAETMVGRARVERWSDERVVRFRPNRPVQPSPPDGWEHWWQVPALRRAAAGGLRWKIGLLLFAAPAVIWVGPWARTAVLWQHSRTHTAVATVVGVEDEQIPFWPHDVEVSFRGPEGPVDTTVPGRGSLHGRVTVRYLVDQPDVVRLTGRDDQLVWGLIFGGGIITLAIGWIGTRFMVALRRTMRSWVALRSPGMPAHYVLAPDPDDSTVVILFDRSGDAPPRLLVPARENALGVLPVSGGCLVHGTAEEGRWVVLRIGQHLLWPAATATSVEPPQRWKVAALVNGGDPYGWDAFDDADDRDNWDGTDDSDAGTTVGRGGHATDRPPAPTGPRPDRHRGRRRGPLTG